MNQQFERWACSVLIVYFWKLNFSLFQQFDVLFIFLIQLLQCNFHASYVPCSNFFWQVFLIHISHTFHHRNRSAIPYIDISATLTNFFWEGAGAGRGLLNTFLSCQHVQNFTMPMEKHSFWWRINENLKEYFSLVNKQRRI